MKWLPSPDTREAVLKHPFFLAGLAVVALLGLTAATLVVADSVRSGTSVGRPTVVVSAETGTAGPQTSTVRRPGVSGTTRSATTVRTAPGDRSPVLGNVPSGSDLQIDGRTTDAKWLRVVFPPNNSAGLHGWIDAASLNVIGDPSTLIVATAEPAVIVDLPTTAPSILTAIARTASADAAQTATPTATSTGGNLPDLVIGSPPNVSAGKLFITVINQGKGELVKSDLTVAVFNADGTKLLGGATLPKFTLAAGRSIDIGTGYPVTEDQSLLLVVDPNGVIAETDDTNNRIVVSIALGEVKTPVPGDEPTPDVPATLIAMATKTAEANINATVIALATATAEAQAAQ